MGSVLAGVLMGVLVAPCCCEDAKITYFMVVRMTPDVLACLMFGGCLILSAILAIVSKGD
ncbi:MAG: hypothetical protein WC856_02590 [Methylococcaceae bacterium]|jgi:hypothetical protein